MNGFDTKEILSDGIRQLFGDNGLATRAWTVDGMAAIFGTLPILLFLQLVRIRSAAIESHTGYYKCTIYIVDNVHT